MESYSSIAAAVVLLLAVLSPAADACNGFRLVVKKAETVCPDGTPSVLTMRDFGVTLTPDCKFIPRGCIKANKKFAMAEVQYSIKTSTGVPLAEGTSNACEAMEKAGDNKGAAFALDLFQLPKNCPVEAVEKCADGKKMIDISPYKDKLAPGSIKAEIKIKHEDGVGISCVTFAGALKK